MNQRERAWLLAASLLLGACGTPVVGSDSGSDVVMDTRPTCTADQMVCNSTCVSVQTDRNHCGACGTVCAGGQVCRAGSCEIECPSGQARCSGACVTLSGDRSNCGACGTMCPAGQVCSAGACATTCASGLTDCMGSC
ncbi:MAG: hypothetical protein Q8Q09_22675, partial [Deltaproteobacteria bacterium]|nr:hypothetical protein [Deltaproteobacteria bacterium]